MSDIDVELKSLFDERLRTLNPPPRTRRPRRTRLGVAAAAATATHVNSVAAANGVDCANFYTKVQVWAQSHRSDVAGTDHSAAKAELARMVAQSGCAQHDATHDASHVGPHH